MSLWHSFIPSLSSFDLKVIIPRASLISISSTYYLTCFVLLSLILQKQKTRIIIITISTCQLNETLYVFAVYIGYIHKLIWIFQGLYTSSPYFHPLVSQCRLNFFTVPLYIFFLLCVIYGSPKEQVFGIFNHSYFTFNFHLLSNALVNTWCYLYTEYLPPFLFLILFYIERLIHTFSISLDFHLLALARAYNVYCVHMDGWMNILYIMFILNELIFWSFFWGD